MEPQFRIFREPARSILSATTGFIARAGFTHSLTPARNCTFRCSYCYVPTMRVQGGLKREDWEHWGQHTTYKSNAPELLVRALRPSQRIYCSPLTDPWQPAEAEECMMPRILEALLDAPPALIAFQTRGPLILRDVRPLRALAQRCAVRISFSLTTDREDIRRLYEPWCAPVEERLATMRHLADSGFRVHATLAPLLPSDPERLVTLACKATELDLVGDPLHVRAVKRSGATTRDAAMRIAAVQGHTAWLDPMAQTELVERIALAARSHGRRFAVGPEGFSCLSQI